MGARGAGPKRETQRRSATLLALGLPLLGLLILSLLPGGCTGSGRGKARVAASIFPLYDITRRVAGVRLPVQLVLPPGQTEHTFDPKPRDVEALSEAQVIFAVGLGLDDWLQTMVKGAGEGTAKVFELAPLLDPILVPAGMPGEQGEKKAESIDPHFWMDPVRMEQAVDLIVAALQRMDPEEGARFRERGNEVKHSLALLHDDISRRAQGWQRRRIVTFHGSLFYFADRYHLQVVGVMEPNAGREPSAAYLADLLKSIRQGKAAAIFSEPQLDRRPAQLIASEAGIPLYEIDPLGGGPGAESYEKLLLRDVEVLDRALK